MKLSNIVFISIFLVLFLNVRGSAAIAGDPIDSVEVSQITHRLQLLLLKNSPGEARVLQLMHSMNDDGSWNGIDYQNMDVLTWSPSQHLGFLFSMAQAFVNPESKLYQDQHLEKLIHRALGFWIDHNFTSRNWWYNDIGEPVSLSNILILIGDKLTDAELLKTLNLMRGSYLHQDGQNLVWRAGIQIKIGLVTFNRGHINLLGSAEDRIKNSVDIIKKEVVVTPEEGIQPDWSFHQHGTQLQFGNYGLTFAQSQVEWAWVLNESSLRYDEHQLLILKNYMLNGLASVVWKGVMDISGCGRSLAPGSPASMGVQTIQAIALLSEIDPANQTDYKNYISCLNGDGNSCHVLRQNNYFWRSDFAVHRTADYYLSVRTHSRYIQSTESGIGQNISGAYLADGATYVYRTGKEYHYILPIWVWSRIPGTTSYPNEPLPPFGWSGLPNEDNFVGGISDGDFGVSAMLFRRDSLTAYKSWFFGPMGVVCLGAGISSPKNTDVSTTVNQSLAKGDIEAGNGKRQFKTGVQKRLDRSDIKWVYHDGIGYIFLQRGKIHVDKKEQQGTWRKVYTGGSDEIVRADVFNLWIDHGVSPKNSGYAYAIFPDLSMDSVKYYAQHPLLDVIQNDTMVQAVEYPDLGMTQIAFYQPTKTRSHILGTAETDYPCLLMTRKDGDNVQLYLSTPPEHGKLLALNYDGHPIPGETVASGLSDISRKINIYLDGRYEGQECFYIAAKNKTRVEFQMPSGIDEGKPVHYTINKK